MKKQLFLFGLSISLMFQSITTPVYALEAEPLSEENIIFEDADPKEEIFQGEIDASHIIQNGSFNPIVDEILTYSAQNFSLSSKQEKAILSAMSNRKTNIDISSYKIPVDEIGNIFIDLVNNHPELYFVQSGCSYSYNSSGYALSLSPMYYDGLGYPKDKAAFEAAANKAIAQTKGIKNNFEKALVLHDYLVLHGEYDISALSSNSYDHSCYSAYGALVNQTAVCQGYALAYKYLLNQVGIECYMVTSDSMNHAWNMVKLDGNYYHVDVTWDDPISDQFGYAQHNYFLLSDNKISGSHYNWVISEGGKSLGYTANSKNYENYVWTGIKSGILPYNNNWYYINSSKKAIVKNSNLSNTNNETTFYSLNSYWNSSPSLAFYEDIFYFPAADGIYQLSAKDTSICKKLTSGSSITGCIIEDNILQYNENGSIKTYTLSNTILTPDTELPPKDDNTNDTETPVEDNTKDDEKDTIEEEAAEVIPPEETSTEGDYKISYQSSFIYTGSPIKANVSIFEGSKQLSEGTDYNITYKNNKNVGAAQIIIKGKNGTSLNVTKTFSITPCNLSDKSIIANSLCFTKSAKNPVPTITRNGKKLSKGKDFTINYPDSINGTYSAIGTYQLEISGCKNYTGNLLVELKILDPETAKLISKASISKIPNIPYTGAKNIPSDVTVKFGKQTLIKGKDYKISYRNCSKIGTAYLILTGKGEYTGEKIISYKIVGTDIKNAIVSGLKTTVEYTGSAIKQNCQLKLSNGTILTEGTDYTVSYNKNISAGKASIIFKGINKYSGTLEKNFTIKPYALTNEDINITLENGETQHYVKSGVKPKVIITFGEIPLREKTNYTLSYKNNKKCGIATITITGKGNFSGKVDKQFTIVE